MYESCLGTPSHLPQKASPKVPRAGARLGLTTSHAPGSIWGLWDLGVSACSQAGGLPAGAVVLGPHSPPSLAAGAYVAPGPGLREPCSVQEVGREVRLLSGRLETGAGFMFRFGTAPEHGADGLTPSVQPPVRWILAPLNAMPPTQECREPP